MGFSIIVRKRIESGESFQLREHKFFYGNDFGVEKVEIEAQNAYFWNRFRTNTVCWRDPNSLKGEEGDELNAILSAAGMNFRKLLRWLAALLRLFFYWLLSFQRAGTGLIPSAE